MVFSRDGRIRQNSYDKYRIQNIVSNNNIISLKSKSRYSVAALFYGSSNAIKCTIFERGDKRLTYAVDWSIKMSYILPIINSYRDITIPYSAASQFPFMRNGDM